MEFVLASKSPRRKELMKFISSSFVIDVMDIDESISYKLDPVNAVKDIAKRKGEIIDHKYPNSVIISADTIVVYDNKIIGKPIDESDAKRILKMLSGKSHYVLTGYRIKYKDKEIINVVKTKVTFNELNEKLINDYVSSKSPLDKAGAYGIQDNKNFPIVKGIVGSLNNVIGFPVEEIKKDLEQVI